MKTDKTIKVDYLARVEGEGGLKIRIKNGKIADLKLNIFEPPRYFEGFLRGRKYSEAPDITARICGICPVAYQMSSIHAMEAVFGLKVTGYMRELRRLLYCGEWIESHVLHAYMLHAPDFLGYQDAIQMAGDHPEIVKAGLRLKKIGNNIVNLLGGREIHPINARIGGWYKIPAKKKFMDLLDDLKWARDTAVDVVKFTSTLNFPDFERDYEFVALSHPDEYALNEGRLISNKGLDIAVDEYEDHFEEIHMSHSTSLHSKRKGNGAYHVGPLARFTLNYDKLSPIAKQAARDAGLGKECYNPFKSIIIRAVETLWACDEAIRILEMFEMPEKPCLDYDICGGIGHAITEAPRGSLYHRYRLDSRGYIRTTKIVPPTSQNLRTMELDLHEFVPPRLDKSTKELTWECEQAIRNYDPCISCSCHFLKLDLIND
ncbi:MAG: Ni/Fe hydrogenase subunit alpha [Calditrichaeota bacterium]|nr:MAG: Ni/Fe hydrogenase subunit alpha [Calditrichota bacterium]